MPRFPLLIGLSSIAVVSATVCYARAAEDDTKAAPSWNVEEPPGPTSSVAIDVDEGTWMSVDLAPDGSEIVFDLLGDIYTIPAGGGAAKALTSGWAWDMQPRFSPDGQWIAFTSDRDGGDNLWIMRRDGSEPRQVSKETFRLVNSPAWTPDGEWIAGRKHFTAERSLGSGEIWLWHRSGGEGLRLTDKPNDQKDVGEPAFSPDGRYLYYSLDATPGSVFEYDKDSNAGIYAIQRLDRETGESVRLVGGPGGAIRPTPSPDGRSLAYVKRVRFQSTLFVQDLASGHERAVYDQLDRDLQETWAIHGVYPAFAWSRDGRELVFWAGGKIRRLAIDTGTVTDVPFRVSDSRSVTAALRFPVEVAPQHFPIKLARWVETSPDGSQVLFQALGKLWVKQLPNGKPTRLTTDEVGFEYEGSWSRDGRRIVYTHFDDQQFGSVRVVASAPGSQPQVITTTPGHYFEPVFSPDGAAVVYRKDGGDFLRGPFWGRDPGIYIVPVGGGPSRLVTTDGLEPQFGAKADRLYLRRVGEADQRSLVSIELDGSDERVEATSEAATRFALSPDGAWLAFIERWNVHVTPFVPTGRPLELGPKIASMPVTRVSSDAGENVHWSGDSKRLHWSLGATLSSLRLDDAFDVLGGTAGEKKIEPRQTSIGFEVPYGAPRGELALIGGRVITLRNGEQEILDPGVVVISGNRITAVGREGEIAVPPSAQQIDVRGKTVIPGLIDVHWHGAQGSDQVIPQQNWVNYASLAYGVTTLHDPSNDTHEIFAAAELQRAGLIVAPRIFSTGTILYGAKDAENAQIESLEDARQHLRRLQAAGAFSVKSYNQPRRNQRQQVIAAARELGMMVVPEGGALLAQNLTQVVDGHTGVEHTVPVGAIYDDVTQLWAGTEVGYTPTLGVAYGGLSGERYWYATTDVWAEEPLSHFVPRQILDARSRRREIAPEEEYNHIRQAEVAKRLLDAGVPVQLGAHGQREGLAAHWEMWMFVQGGMSPFEALRAATLDGAKYLGLDRDLGSIEAGKLADLVILDANPLEDIRLSTKIHQVLANGRLYDAATMNELAPEPRPRQPFWWETPATQ
jgi:imidazolonepropionase-like amidohydrolase/Tol biopolymer transport system component